MPRALDGGTKTQSVQRIVWGVPVYRQRFSLPASRPATERIYRLIRVAMAHAEHLQDPIEGSLECGETTFGGACKGKRGWGAAGKVIVFGIVKRNGTVKAQPIPAHDRTSIINLIQAENRDVRSTMPTNGRPMPPCDCAATMSSSERRKAGRSGATISTGSKASGHTLKTGCIHTVVY
jgi:hypothetical protein